MVKTKKKNIIICIITAFFSMIMLLLGLIVPKLSGIEVEIDPKEVESTVVEVSQKDKDYLIIVEEYSCKLFVDSNAIFNKDALLSLRAGDKIFFKLVKLDENVLENPQIEQVFVVTLRTKTQDIITLQSYLQKEKKGMENIKIITIIGAIILGGISILNLVMIFKRSKTS